MHDKSESAEDFKSRLEMPHEITCLCFVASFYQISINLKEIARLNSKFSKYRGLEKLAKIGQEWDFRTKIQKINSSDIFRLKLPAIIKTNNENFLVITAAQHDQLIAFDPLNPTRGQRYTTESLNLIWSGKILLFSLNSINQSNLKDFGFEWLCRVATQNKKLISKVIFGSFTIQLLGIALPLFSQLIIDKVLMHQSLSALHVLGVGMGLFICFEAIMVLTRSKFSAIILRKLDIELSTKTITSLLRLPVSFFEHHHAGRVTAYLRDLEQIRNFFNSQSLLTSIDLLFTLVFVVLMFFYSIQLTIITLVFAVLTIVCSIIMHYQTKKEMDKLATKNIDQHSLIYEIVNGIQTIKGFALEEKFKADWYKSLLEQSKFSFDLTVRSGTSNAISQFIQRLSNLTVLWFGTTLVLVNQLTIGQLIAFQMISNRVIHPLLRVAQLWQEISHTKYSIDRLGGMLNAEFEEDRNMPFPSSNESEILISNLTFTYPGAKYSALKNINLQIFKGSFAALIGKSGSGKSTLLKLLQNFYSHFEGNIQINGVDIRQFSKSDLRRNIAVVQHDSILFRGTILENIAITSPNYNYDAIQQAAHLACAHEFISHFPEGYDTFIIDKGSSLSAGQRQRIALARAILSNPSVLILDEATSAVDMETEKLIHENLKEWKGNKTILIITHRVQTVEVADVVYVIDSGSITSTETPQNLFIKSNSTNTNEMKVFA